MKLKFLLLKWTLRTARQSCFLAMKNASARTCGALLIALRMHTNEPDSAA